LLFEVIRGEQYQRDDQVVPDGQGQGDDQGRRRRAQQRQDDVPVGAQRPRAVDGGRLLQYCNQLATQQWNLP
jgi:hypothetical protein